ncbi:MAG: DUF4286 family protein [Runella slithyformis]|jgi:hypothetical protein|nr:MAG: DUF4286 family protein [Cytophagales bacterium]TAF83739.1 MAG: DUF4286 family protein [Runella slithyformis]TAG42346.1 MAG: DUF4286 family protein [Cytophagia bacterium]TAG24697.1 MAG: DUF4286 family protein [Cytophagales bacterium]TAG57048.1 MAG: DUF4286 family protein [Runella slithyformis]
MIRYNVTININQELQQEWLHWVKTKHLPAVMATGLPVAYQILRLLTELDNGGATYSVQLSFNEMEDYLTYQTLHQPELQQNHHDRYNGQYVSFRTLLEEV